MPSLTESRSSAPFPAAAPATGSLAFLYGAFAFAFIGGYADATGYMLADTFTGHITGAFVLSAISAAGHAWHACALRLAGIACFVIGVFFAAVLEQRLAKKLPRRLLSLVIAIEIVLVLFGYRAAASAEKSTRELMVFCLSLALGLQNGIWRRIGGVSVHTTFLTGIVLNLVASETEGELSHPQKRAPLASRIGLPLGVWLAFFGGAATGAAATFRFHAGGVLGAALLLLLVMVANLATRRPQPV